MSCASCVNVFSLLCRPRQAWEASDGAVYLLRHLTEVMPQQALEFLPLLAHIAALNHFPQARNLQETIWKQLGAIMLALGKRVSVTSPTKARASSAPSCWVVVLWGVSTGVIHLFGCAAVHSNAYFVLLA